MKSFPSLIVMLIATTAVGVVEASDDSSVIFDNVSAGLSTGDSPPKSCLQGWAGYKREDGTVMTVEGGDSGSGEPDHVHVIPTPWHSGGLLFGCAEKDSNWRCIKACYDGGEGYGKNPTFLKYTHLVFQAKVSGTSESCKPTIGLTRRWPMDESNVITLEGDYVDHGELVPTEYRTVVVPTQDFATEQWSNLDNVKNLWFRSCGTFDLVYDVSNVMLTGTPPQIAGPSPTNRNGITSTTTKTAPGVGGDPHFKTWSGKKFDYHGECDLVLLDHPSYNNGQGLKVHIRTTRVNVYSYIETIAVQIGSDTLEFSNDIENFLINNKKVEANKKGHKTRLGGHIVRRLAKVLSIRLGHDAQINLFYRKNGFPYVQVDAHGTDIFVGSTGLLGDYETGNMIARDGQTIINDPTEYAKEWQVQDTEPMLFSLARFPQYPTVCTPPKKMLGKRLGDSHMKEAAIKACSSWGDDAPECVFDVMATRDVGNAEPLGKHHYHNDAAAATVSAY